MKKKLPQLLLCTLIIAFIFISVNYLQKRTTPFRRPMLSFRFDDAFKSQLQACEILNSMKIRPTIYCITSCLDSPPYMSWKEIRHLQSLGNEIGSHTMTHPRLPLLLPGDHRIEILGSKKMLKEHGIAVRSIAYPYGMYNPLLLYQVRDNYSNGVKYHILSKGEMNFRNSDPFLLSCYDPVSHNTFKKLLDEAMDEGAWLVVCFHKFGEENSPFTVKIEEFRKMAQTASLFRERGLIDIVTISKGAERLSNEVPD